MALSDMAVRQTKAEGKVEKISDGRGLYLEIKPTGSKYWRWSYRFDGKQNTLAFGVYPDVSLATARQRRDQARALLANGVDPSDVKKYRRRRILKRLKPLRSLPANGTIETCTHRRTVMPANFFDGLSFMFSHG